MRPKMKAISDLKKGMWVSLTTFCKEIGPTLTGNLDATQAPTAPKTANGSQWPPMTANDRQ